MMIHRLQISKIKIKLENKMKYNELAQRITTVILLTIFSGLVLLLSEHPVVMIALVIFLAGLAVYEIYSVMGFGKDIPFIVITEIIVVAVSCIRIPKYTFLLTFIYPVIVLFFFTLMITHKRFTLDSKFQAFLIAMVILYFFQALKELRLVNQGFYYLSFGILVSVLTDSFAFVWGKLIGKHKMAPTVSPKKTWEGSLGGALSALFFIVLIAMLEERLENITVMYYPLVIVTLAASALSQLGDLSMSVIKRICGVKDFGSIFPGHGGVLDRFDSHLFAIPFVLITQTYLLDFIN